MFVQPSLHIQSQPSPTTWTVLKLGGTTMASAVAVRNALDTVADRVPDTGPRDARIAVVTSALSGVTNQLTHLADVSPGPADRYRQILASLRDRHLEHLARLAQGDPERLVVARLGLHLGRIEHLAQQLARGVAPELATRVEILATGERMSAVIFWAALASRGLGAQVVDAGELLAAEGPADNARPMLAASRLRAAIRLGVGGPRRLVMPGFFARGADGALKLLGRGGSDTAASLLGAALGARQIEIWTDVDGVYPDDPRHHPDLAPFAHLSFDAAEHLARAGAKVLHPRSVAPARETGAQLWVRHGERLEAPGTWIGDTRIDAIRPGSAS